MSVRRLARLDGVRLDAPVELYHIEQDPGETSDLSKSNPEMHVYFTGLFEEYT